MMKKYLLILLSILSFTSCIKDEGNYDYTTLKEVQIGGLVNSYRFVLQKTQTIAPEITTEIAPDDLSYCWRVGGDTLSTDKAFTHTFTKVLASSEPLTFEVIDKLTNIRFVKRMNLAVVSPFETGWLIFGDVQGKAQLDFQSYEDEKKYFTDIYKEVNGEDLSGTAKIVKQLNYQDPSTGAYMDRVSVICKGGKSVELDGSSFLKRKYYEDEFKGTSLSVDAISSEHYSIDNSLFIISKGNIYAKTPGSMGTPDEAYYQYPLSGDSQGYSVAANYTKGYSNGDFYLCLDELNHRYVDFQRSSLSTKVSSLTVDENSSAVIDPDHVDGTSVWMGQAYNGNALSIVKTDAGKYVLHVLSCIWDGSWTLLAKYDIPDGVINATTCFTSHKVNPYLMIATGNKLMALNLEALSSGVAAINDVHTYEAPITAMHYAYNANKGVNEFGIAIQESATSSTLLLINPSLTAMGEILKRYENMKGTITSLWRKIM
ncbi:PKD-like family lipoprotein [uncultured Bacteroides sp.]|uniref:PKD-like family lipoprotein n=1 Tax=uncultured Bacteroides sp. TaxID=162156 RepID=UPI002AAAAB92|nr:PKD-like family lipoprotein [uncultured Bacteroides sp.]